MKKKYLIIMFRVVMGTALVFFCLLLPAMAQENNQSLEIDDGLVVLAEEQDVVFKEQENGSQELIHHEADQQSLALPAQEPDQYSLDSIEIDGDIIEFFQQENKVVIEGGVSIVKGDVYLFCDRVEYFHDTGDAFAKGNVLLLSSEGEVRGEELTFNFGTMTGDFKNARIFSDPYYGAGEKIEKAEDDKIKMTQGYVTTCDLDHPHYRLNAKKIDVHPGDRVKAKNLTLRIGKLPIFWFPQFTKIIEDSKPSYMITPGYDKDWGIFLLTKWRYFFSEQFRGHVKLDIREKKDVAVGLDNFYKTDDYGQGLVDVYYMNEGGIISKRWWKKQPSPTVDRERFKAEWRHSWSIDDTTRAVWQYYKISDSDFLKDYFRRAHDRDPNPKTYFLLTKSFDRGILSFRTDKRINRFTSSVERLPEIRYDFFDQEIGSTNLYFQSKNVYTNLSYPAASPSDIRPETQRIHSDHKISYPFKFGFLEIAPFVGQQVTYYSKSRDPSEDHLTRTAFRTGADLQTRFYKTFDVQGSLLGMQVDQIRHIVAPSVSYSYMHAPSVSSDKLEQFDSIDNLAQEHKIVLSLDNRLQTKRQERTVDLLFMNLSTDFYLKEDDYHHGFRTLDSKVEFRPTDWLTFYNDTSYHLRQDRVISSNQEIQFRGQERWSLNLSRRYSWNADDQLTADFRYNINPKWRFHVYERFHFNSGNLKEQQYTITRDLHCWEMDVSFNHTHGEGSKIWIVFRMKAFPDMAIDFIRTRFNRRAVGSQQGE